ncbi:MAG: hypothetical protein JXN59_14150, partial [Anaerolineae bacterium]|nr:hypothetical protein [Anaerolineae bacterium]
FAVLGMLMITVSACAPAVSVPRPGQLLYVTTFDAFNEDWQLYQGELSAQVTAGEAGPTLEIGVAIPQSGAFTVLDQQFTDFDVIVEARQVAGPQDIDAPGFGVLFRHRDNDNFYAFMISGDGYYQVSRRLDGVDQVLSDWAATDAVLQGQAVNTVRVVGQGDEFQFLINDIQVPLCTTIWNPLVPGECQVPPSVPGEEPTWSADAVTMTLSDDALSQGRIGLGARSFSQAGVQVQFDNLLVCGPADSPPIPFRCEEDVVEGA